jgi:hypothetical protein
MGTETSLKVTSGAIHRMPKKPNSSVARPIRWATSWTWVDQGTVGSPVRNPALGTEVGDRKAAVLA